jgi:hypothetical protein
VDFGKNIKELLLLHDCVILPELGGFVANYRPAVFDPVRNTASPPSKHILFNHNLVHNDGLLYAHVSAATDYGYKDVQKMAMTYVEGIRDSVRQGKKFEIEGLGYFYLDPEKQIQFAEESGHNFLLESYGLPFLQYREFEKLRVTEAYRVLHTESDPLARQRRIRRWMYATAAACLLTALVLVPVRTGYFNRAGMDISAGDSHLKEQPAGTANPADRTGRSTASPFSSTRDRAGTGEIPATATLSATEYNIVVGSFRDFGNARSLRSRLEQEGYPARILVSGQGFFRVSAGTYSLQEEAAGNLATIRQEFETAWILSN